MFLNLKFISVRTVIHRHDEVYSELLAHRTFVCGSFSNEPKCQGKGRVDGKKPLLLDSLVWTEVIHWKLYC